MTPTDDGVPSPTTPQEMLTEAIAEDRADWLLDAIAGATQNRMFLRGDDAYDEVTGEAILLNAKKAIGVAMARAHLSAGGWREAAKLLLLRASHNLKPGSLRNEIDQLLSSTPSGEEPPQQDGKEEDGTDRSVSPGNSSDAPSPGNVGPAQVAPQPEQEGEIIVWNDPLCTKEGFVANSVSRATPAAIITAMKGNFPERNYSDQEALDDFMVVHWAWRENAPLEQEGEEWFECPSCGGDGEDHRCGGRYSSGPCPDCDGVGKKRNAPLTASGEGEEAKP